MSLWQRLRALGRNDVRLIGRDDFMVTMFAYVFVLAVVFRYLLPWLDGYLAAQGVLPTQPGGTRIADLEPMIVAYLTLYVGALLPGMMFGFLLLEEKEDETLTALRVTPMRTDYYLWYRVGVPALLSGPMIASSMAIVGRALVAWWQVGLLAAAATPTAPIVSLGLATFADNKVQGFAASKFLGLAGLTLIGGWFVAEPAQWLFGLFPPFLVSKAYWMALDGRSAWWLVLFVGVVLQIVLIGGLVWQFQRSLEG